MNAFDIKIIAVTAMVIDHVGQFFFPEVQIFRMIGRISFPLFAWLIANGAYYTKNINKYLVRLGALAIVSQVPYFFANRLLDPQFNKLNVLFTLFLGLFAIKLLRHKKLYVRFILIAVIILAVKVKMSYGVEGIISIIAFYLFLNKPYAMILSQTVIYTSEYLFLSLFSGSKNLFTVANEYGYYAPLALFSLPLLFLYNGKKGRGYKYLFYVFYPLQYVFYYIVKLLIS